MQQPPPAFLRQRLIDAVDDKYHVIDMAAIVEVLGTLESLPVTKEVLESTRLGRTVNEFRRRVDNELLAKRAKDLVKKWRDQVLPELPQHFPPPSFVGRPINGNAFLVSEGPGPGPGGTFLSSVNGKAAYSLATSLHEVSGGAPSPSEHSLSSHVVTPSSSSVSVNGSVYPVLDGSGGSAFSFVSSRISSSRGISSASILSSSLKLSSSTIVRTALPESPGSNDPMNLPLKSRGRKRKRKPVTMEDKLADVTSLLKGQIAKANELRSGILRVPPTSTYNSLDDPRSPSSPDVGHSLSATLSPDDQLIKNDLVEKYLKSQSELKSQMERQYQDRLARNEFQDSVTEEDAETNSSVNSVMTVGDVTDAASAVSSASTMNRPKLSAKKGFKASARRKKQEQEAEDDTGETEQVVIQFETEVDILSKLPPLDPELLAEFENFEFDSFEPVAIVPQATANLTKIETERLSESTAYLGGNLNVSASSESRNKIFDFGDSDDDDESDFIEVQTHDDSFRPGEIETSPTIVTTGMKAEIPSREVEDSEVTRLLTEEIENLNGNLDKAGTYREWHETLVVQSYGGEDLLILPYCVIDF